MTPQQETWATVEAIGMTSFAYVMSVESMSQCIFESEAKEGVTESHEHTRLQMNNPEKFQDKTEELDYYHAMATQINEQGYETVRASDGTWITRWAQKFNVRVKGYGIRNYNGWTLEPLGWPDGDEAQKSTETAAFNSSRYGQRSEDANGKRRKADQ